ncbi:MAG: hypothetical protein WD048_12975 [Chitinophagales bacterium]
MSKTVRIIWSKHSLKNAISIKQYLLKHFTNREVDNFQNLLSDFEKTILNFPNIYPRTIKKYNLRRAVLSRFLSVYYQSKRDRIIVIAMYDNRQLNPIS